MNSLGNYCKCRFDFDNYSSECAAGFFVTHNATHETSRIMPQAGQACDRGQAGKCYFY